jgi:RimJ/RimL family protein N-acetyltransferase
VERSFKSSEFVLPGRLVCLRPTTWSDIADYERWNVPGLKSWEFDGPWHGGTLDKVIENRKKWLGGDRMPPYRRLEIDVPDCGHVGWVTAYTHADDPHMTEAGIDIVDDRLWNRGLGTEAFGLWTDYLFDAYNLTRLGYSTWSGNPRMIRVGEKLGFVLEGRIRRGCEVKGQFYDRIKMGLLREEWQARHGLTGPEGDLALTARMKEKRA